MRKLGFVAIAAAFGIGAANRHVSLEKAPPLVVHEWGTITTMQSSAGVALGRLNHVDFYEPLASFVHRYSPVPANGRSLDPLLKAPVGDGRLDITMRLETPVVYFHPAAGAPLPAPFDVDVKFRGGVLNEFYPEATPSVNGWNGEHLSDSVVSSLRWKSVALREHVTLPATNSRVWLAPRTAKSAPVVVNGGETEQYLFYRGMASLPALLQAELTGDSLVLRSAVSAPWMTSPSASLGTVWVADIGADRQAAFRATDPLTLTRDAHRVIARVPLFDARDYSASALTRLHDSMYAALVAVGLFPDEAAAMLETWKASYFGVPGLRVFYIVPNEWTSYYLPLTISTPHTLTRAIVGRIDIQTSTNP